AMTCEKPAVTVVTPLPGPRPLTCTGRWASFGASLLPISPDWLLPHAHTEPSVLITTQKEPPAAIFETPDVRPDTTAGVDRSVVVLSPNSPEASLPQVHTEPSIFRAMLNESPAAIAVTGSVELGAMTCSGMLRSGPGSTAPSPSCPDAS